MHEPDSTRTVTLGSRAYRIREVGVADVATIAAQRERMFVEHSRAYEGALAGMTAAFGAWLRRKLHEGKYIGWFAEFEHAIIGGVGVFLVEWPPHPAHFGPLRGYVMNAFTDPAHRGKGIDDYLMRLAARRARAAWPAEEGTARPYARWRLESLLTPGAAEAGVEVGPAAAEAFAPMSPRRRSP